MRTLVPDPPPVEIADLLERRRATGTDRWDEVWEGVLHMAPASRGRHDDLLQQIAVIIDAPARAAGLLPTVGGFNLGELDDYRIPDGGLRSGRVDAAFYDTAALVLEVVSPGDETWEKLPFYAAHDVNEVLIVDPQERAVTWLALSPSGDYAPAEHSGLIDLGPAALAERLDWPPLDNAS